MKYPFLANQLQVADDREETQALLADAHRYDLVILDAEMPGILPGIVERIKGASDNECKVYGYWSLGDLAPPNHYGASHRLHRRYCDLIGPAGRLKNADGSNVRYPADGTGQSAPPPPGVVTELPNLFDSVVREKTIEFLRDKVARSFDGLFLDRAGEEGIAYISPAIDADNDGAADDPGGLNWHYRSAVREILSTMEAAEVEVIANGTGWHVPMDVSIMVETFMENASLGPPHDWASTMKRLYQAGEGSVLMKRLDVGPGGPTPEQIKEARFAFGSALLVKRCRFCLTNRTGPYRTNAWLPEFWVDVRTGEQTRDPIGRGWMGRPITPAFDVFSGDPLLKILYTGRSQRARFDHLWGRLFEYAVVFVNPTPSGFSFNWDEPLASIDGTIAQSFSVAPGEALILRRVH